ncbi:hypothetical protein, partial [Streptomyces sp. NPDC001480]|uniref:hypothetical protein n=1 Tax=Streptomyces sp. NPDC001480 TaxID=3364577 RepID=UPI00368552B3
MSVAGSDHPGGLGKSLARSVDKGRLTAEAAAERATYVFVAASSRIRISVIVCKARLSCRSPLR